MTVGSQVKQTQASLKGVKATLDLYALQSTKEEEKELYQRNSEKVASVLKFMEQRVAELEFEEPQYKGF